MVGSLDLWGRLDVGACCLFMCPPEVEASGLVGVRSPPPGASGSVCCWGIAIRCPGVGEIMVRPASIGVVSYLSQFGAPGVCILGDFLEAGTGSTGARFALAIYISRGPGGDYLRVPHLTC